MIIARFYHQKCRTHRCTLTARRSARMATRGSASQCGSAPGTGGTRRRRRSGSGVLLARQANVLRPFAGRACTPILLEASGVGVAFRLAAYLLCSAPGPDASCRMCAGRSEGTPDQHIRNGRGRPASEVRIGYAACTPGRRRKNVRADRKVRLLLEASGVGVGCVPALLCSAPWVGLARMGPCRFARSPPPRSKPRGFSLSPSRTRQWNRRTRCQIPAHSRKCSVQIHYNRSLARRTGQRD
jgi:hypothetical protein